MGQSNKNSLSSQDIGKWLGNTIKFSVPALLAFLIALQPTGVHVLPTKETFTFALGAGYSALISSLIDLLTKYKQGV